MADSPETRVLKDVNRHLQSIDMTLKQKAGDQDEQVEKQQAFASMHEMIGNFESLLDARLKKVVLTTDRAFNEAFGNLEGFNAEQTDAMIQELNNIIDELEISNKFMKSADDLEFLKEKEREEDLNINRRTNDLLEDILDKEDDRDRAARLGGGGDIGGLAGLGLGVLGLQQLKRLFSKGGLLRVGKLLGGSLLSAFFLKPFLEGFAEDMEDDAKSFTARLFSGLGKMLEEFSFGLFTQEQLESLGAKFEKRMDKSIADMQKTWDDYWKGGATLSDAIAGSLSALSLGVISPEAFKSIGEQIKFFADQFGEAFIVSIFAAAGYDVKNRRITAEERQRRKDSAERIKKLEADYRQKFMTVPEIERLLAQIDDPRFGIERKFNIRKRLGDLAPLTADEISKIAQKGGDVSAAVEKRTQEREAYIERITRELQQRIDRAQFLEDRRIKREKDVELKAKEKEATAERIAQRIQELEAQEKALQAARERTQGETGNVLQQNNNSFTTPVPDTGVDNDDANWYRDDGLR